MSKMVANVVALNKLPDSVLNALSNRVSDAIHAQTIPTASLAVFHYDSPILDVAWGWLDPFEQTIQTKTTTLFDLSTITRAYTTVAALAYISAEKFYLQSPITHLVPELTQDGQREIGHRQDRQTGKRLPIQDHLVGKTVNPETVNFFHLLTHTSGLPAWRDLYTVNPPPSLSDKSRSVEERWNTAWQTLYQYPFVDIPETSVIPSDIGYMILGDVIGRVHNDTKSLQTVIEDTILGDRFSRTTFNPLQNGFEQHEIAPTALHNEWRNRPIWGEVYDNNASSLGGVTGHSGLFSTAFDVSLFGNMWLNHADKLFKVDPDLAGASVELQAQTGSDLVGLGWMLKAPNTLTNGDLFSTQSYGQQSDIGTSLWIDPQEKLVISLLTNYSYGEGDYVAYLNLKRDIHNIIIDFVQG